MLFRYLPMTSDHSSENQSQRGRPFRSKLLPYAREIARWQREVPPKSYPEMARLLKDKYGVAVHPDTINSFVLTRVRGKGRAVLPDEFLAGEEEASSSPQRDVSAIPGPLPSRQADAAPAPPKAPLPAVPAVNPEQRPRRMLPTVANRHHDSIGRPIEGPPDPHKNRAENL